jgi:hypothetical protein
MTKIHFTQNHMLPTTCTTIFTSGLIIPTPTNNKNFTLKIIKHLQKGVHNMDKSTNTEILWESDGIANLRQEPVVDNSSKKAIRKLIITSTLIILGLCAITLSSGISIVSIMIISMMLFILFIILKSAKNGKIKYIPNGASVQNFLEESVNQPIEEKSHYTLTDEYLIIEDFVANKPVYYRIPYHFINEYEFLSGSDGETIRVKAEFYPDEVNEPELTKTIDFFLKGIANSQKAYEIIEEKYHTEEIKRERAYRLQENERLVNRIEPQKNKKSSRHSKLNDSEIKSKLN